MAVKTEVLLICPVRDEGESIGRLLNCLKSQTLLDWRIVIGDNASTDQTVAAVREFSGGDHRIDLDMFETSVHVAENFKRTRDMALARYAPKYVGYVGGDDEYLEATYLENLVGALKSGNSIAVPTFCLLDWDGRNCKSMPFPNFSRYRLINRIMHSLNSNYGNIFYSLFRIEDFVRVSTDRRSDLNENLSSDWWFLNTAFRLVSKPPKYVSSSTYFKYNKRISYTSDYYSAKDLENVLESPARKKGQDVIPSGVLSLARAKLIFKNVIIVPTVIIFKEPKRISKFDLPELCFLWLVLVASRFLFAVSPNFFYGDCPQSTYGVNIDVQ